jgi:hypothetical protein
LKWSKWSVIPFVGFGFLSAGMSHGLTVPAVATNVSLYLAMGLSVAFGQVVFDTVRELRDGRWMAAVILTIVATLVGQLVGLVAVGYVFGPNAPFFFTKSAGLIAGS